RRRPADRPRLQRLTDRSPKRTPADAEVIRESWQIPDQFGVLYDRYAGLLYGYACQRVGRSAAEDLVADASSPRSPSATATTWRAAARERGCSASSPTRSRDGPGPSGSTTARTPESGRHPS